MASLFIRALARLWAAPSSDASNVRPVNQRASGQAMGKHEQMFQKPCQQALKPTRPGPSPPPRIAKGLDASVQMARCCQEIVFKRAPAPCLNIPKAVALLVKRDI